MALICDDQVFVKITVAGKQFVGSNYQEGNAYPGAKPSMLIGDEIVANPEAFCELISLTAANL